MRTLHHRASASLAVLISLATLARAGEPVRDDPRQIRWQRSLADALAIAKAEDRAIFVAINMDGESACDRIVREEYRDPRFVAATRPFVCVVASVARHEPRDHDDAGRRIACPRLGVVTCAEHLVLEPELYERWLKDGERVAPRHALVMQDGRKAWDVALAFDLRDVDEKLTEAARVETARRAKLGLDDPSKVIPALDGVPEKSWLGYAGSKDAGDRDFFEMLLGRAVRREEQRSFVLSALDAIGRAGDAGSIEALRVVLGRPERLDDPLRAKVVAVARALKLEKEVAGVARDALRSLGRFPGAVEPDAGVPNLLPLLAELDGKDAATRTFLLACRALGDYGARADEAIAIALGASEAKKVADVLARHRSGLRLANVLGTTSKRADGAREEPDAELAAVSEFPDAATLERELATLEPELGKRGDDVELMARYGHLAAQLARRRIEASAKGPEVRFLIEDAEQWLARASEKRPDRYAWWLERARVAYLLGKFEEEAAFGERALALSGATLPSTVPITAWGLGTMDVDELRRAEGLDALGNARATEAYRWIGDAHARAIAERSGKDPAAEIEGLVLGASALAMVAATDRADATDWTSFSSFFGAVGMWREELAILQEAALRLPAAQEIRQQLNASLWNAGRIDLAPRKADWIAEHAASSADAQWFAGHAWVLAGEDARRRQAPGEAVDAYTHARERFERVIATKPEYADGAREYVARAELGRANALLLANDRDGAARALVEAVGAKRELASVRDGLDRDVLDVVDGIFEWRASGPSRIAPKALSDALHAAAPGDATWDLAISDALLREALRADGRNPDRVERDTVDAGGNPIRMLLGKPTEEGDALLRSAIGLAERARALRDDEETRRVLAQCETIRGERALERERVAEAREALERAAPLVGKDAPAKGDRAALDATASELRALLGPARPKFRPGR